MSRVEVSRRCRHPESSRVGLYGYDGGLVGEITPEERTADMDRPLMFWCADCGALCRFSLRDRRWCVRRPDPPLRRRRVSRPDAAPSVAACETTSDPASSTPTTTARATCGDESRESPCPSGSGWNGEEVSE